MTTREVLDKVLLASVATLAIWVGTSIQKLLDSNQKILERLAVMTEQNRQRDMRIEAIEKAYKMARRD